MTDDTEAPNAAEVAKDPDWARSRARLNEEVTLFIEERRLASVPREIENLGPIAGPWFDVENHKSHLYCRIDRGNALGALVDAVVQFKPLVTAHVVQEIATGHAREQRLCGTLLHTIAPGDPFVGHRVDLIVIDVAAITTDEHRDWLCKTVLTRLVQAGRVVALVEVDSFNAAKVDDKSSHIVTISGGHVSADTLDEIRRQEIEFVCNVRDVALETSAMMRRLLFGSTEEGRSFTIEDGPFAGTHVKVRPCAAPSTTGCTITIGFDGEGASDGLPVEEAALDKGRPRD